jgi:hypothetical protein
MLIGLVVPLLTAPRSEYYFNGGCVVSFNYKQVAFAFTKHLIERQYAKAYAMTTKEYRGRMGIEQLQCQFEKIVPLDWGPFWGPDGPIEVGHTMTDWPGKQPHDLGWIYVSIGGEGYSEAVTVIVASEDNAAKVRDVEFGRP